MKEKLYINLPITGRDINAVKKQAEELRNIWGSDYEVITPFDICPEDGKDYSCYMGKDIEELLKCDAIYMSPGWINSKGCNAEFQIAKIYGKRILGC